MRDEVKGEEITTEWWERGMETCLWEHGRDGINEEQPWGVYLGYVLTHQKGVGEI